MSFSPSLSPQLSSSLRGLPLVPGVYIFKNATGKIIYVGKAKALKNRVSQYFHSPKNLGAKTKELVAKINSLEYIEVGTEIEALLLESKLIKKLRPFYNITAKDDKSPYYIHLSKEEFPRPIITHERAGSLAGPFLNGYLPRKILRYFRSVTPYCTAKRPVKKPCFYSHIGLCQPCPGYKLPQSKTDYKENITKLKRLIGGNFSQVESKLKKEMASAAKNKDYETAAQKRDHLQALNHLLSTPVLPEEYLANPNLIDDTHSESLLALTKDLHPYFPNLLHLNRIEMYDIAHLSGTAATGAMTVAQAGRISPNQYRHFTIKGQKTTSDMDMMYEVVSRRLKNTTWPTPDLLVLDGGIPQLSTVSQIGSTIPIISLAKKAETLIVPHRGKFISLSFPPSHLGLQLLVNLRNEAHRFSRRLHHLHRQKSVKL